MTRETTETPPASPPGMLESCELSLDMLLRGSRSKSVGERLPPRADVSGVQILVCLAATAALTVGLEAASGRSALARSFFLSPTVLVSLAAITLAAAAMTSVFWFLIPQTSEDGALRGRRALHSTATTALAIPLAPLFLLFSWGGLLYCLIAARAAYGASDVRIPGQGIVGRLLCAAATFIVFAGGVAGAHAWSLSIAPRAGDGRKDVVASPTPDDFSAAARTAPLGGVPPPISGLDLLRKPSGLDDASETAPRTPQEATARAADLRRQAAAMLDSALPALEQAMKLSASDPRQRAKQAELRSLIKLMRDDARLNRPISDAEFDRRMKLIQKIMLGIMGSPLPVAQKPVGDAGTGGPR